MAKQEGTKTVVGETTKAVKTPKNKPSTKSAPKKSAPKKSAPKKSAPTVTVATKEKKGGQEAVEGLTKNATKIHSREDRDMNEMISVISITNSPLVYVSKSQRGYRVDWGGFLEENWIEYKELLNMRGAQRAFFEQPWIICEWDVLEDLRVTQYYKNMIDLAGLDELFKKSPANLEKTLKNVPQGIRDLIVDRAFEMRRDGELDSINTIKTIERVYDIDLNV